MTRSDIDAYVIKLAHTFSAYKAPRINHQVYADLGISGSDAVEFYDTIEKHFAVDLHPITECSIEIPQGKFRNARSERVARDPSLEELCTFIDGSLGRRN